MLSFNLGPLALPLNPLLMLLGWWLASALAERLAADAPGLAGQAFFRAAVAGWLAARVVFVVQAIEAYAASPWAVLDLRDGGWSPWAGLAVALAVLTALAVRQARLRKPLAAGAAAGLAFWGALSSALGVHDRLALPALNLRDLAGTPVALAPAGRPMVVNLWASWCTPCVAEMPILAAAQQRRPGVRFLFVNHGESAPVVQRWLAARPYRLDGVLLDAGRQLGSAVGSAGLPTTLFIDADGRLVERHFGPLSAASLDAKLRRLRVEAGPISTTR